MIEEFFAYLRESKLFLVIDSHFNEIDHLLRSQRIPEENAIIKGLNKDNV